MEAAGMSGAFAVAQARVRGARALAFARDVPAFGSSQVLSNGSLACSLAAVGPASSTLRDGRVGICAAFVGNEGGFCLGRQSILTSRLLRSRNSGALPAQGEKSRKQDVIVRGSNRPGAGERVLSAVSYFLPLLDGIQYGRYFFQQFPVAETLFYPLFPILQAYKSIPYSNLIVFFTLYLGVVRNEKTDRYVKFNAMQAVVLDVPLYDLRQDKQNIKHHGLHSIEFHIAVRLLVPDHPQVESEEDNQIGIGNALVSLENREQRVEQSFCNRKLLEKVAAVLNTIQQGQKVRNR
eukprot:TRINITY_DN11504_c0_g2_i1.p1 TRINITY_DN11504_c0_g2~~TRINITY_DN11504_c0_g2_i1.p1  ORF type:complete len:293 (+),score=34.84 TRINITY_DN11504_c0_g2_i1:60-938(+)